MKSRAGYTRLQDVVVQLLIEHGYTNKRCHEEFGVGVVWLTAMKSGVYANPRSDLMQDIYEKLTGRPLLPPPPPKANPQQAEPTGGGAASKKGQ